MFASYYASLLLFVVWLVCVCLPCISAKTRLLFIVPYKRSEQTNVRNEMRWSGDLVHMCRWIYTNIMFFYAAHVNCIFHLYAKNSQRTEPTEKKKTKEMKANKRRGKENNLKCKHYITLHYGLISIIEHTFHKQISNHMVHLYKNYVFPPTKKWEKRTPYIQMVLFLFSFFFFVRSFVSLVVAVILLLFHVMHSNDKKCVYCVPVSLTMCTFRMVDMRNNNNKKKEAKKRCVDRWTMECLCTAYACWQHYMLVLLWIQCVVCIPIPNVVSAHTQNANTASATESGIELNNKYSGYKLFIVCSKR